MLPVSSVAINRVRVVGLFPPSRPGGRTPPNLAALVGGENDHCIRHQTGWTYQPLPNGDYLWTSPLGGPGYTTSGNDPP